MGKIGYGYGSEWHLTRYLGRHRHAFNRAVEEATSGQVVDWLDFPFGTPKCRYLAEHKGLDFLAGTASQPLIADWGKFWPQTGNVQNWDAVGWLRNGSRMELLLVEAKCHAGELRSACAGKGHGLSTIVDALDRSKAFYGAAMDSDWLKPYYQYCNRLAILHFLREHHIPARLLFVYFTGDQIHGKIAPTDEKGWHPALQSMYDHIGVQWDQQRVRGVCKVFLPVGGPCPSDGFRLGG